MEFALFKYYPLLNLSANWVDRNFSVESIIINTGEIVSIEPIDGLSKKGNYTQHAKMTLKSGREIILANTMQEVMERYGFNTSRI